MVQREEIIAVLRSQVPKHVLLTPYGNELSARSLIKTPSVAKEDVEGNADLFDMQRLNDAVAELYLFFKKTRKLFREFNSYGWKHYLERKPGVQYISSGTFAMAAYLAGFKVHWPKENGSYGVNAVFNIEPREWG